MTENSFHQNLIDPKPVNINISFNITKKQVTQNINTAEHQKTHLHKNIPDQDINSNIKPKNHFYRPPKTPQLAYTDRNNLSKDFQFIRPTEELKRKKKVKRSSGDYTADKTCNFPFYQNELDKSLPNHKRGYTTSFTKKSTSQMTTKKKKPANKAEQIQKQNRTVNLYDSVKQGKSSSTSKSLKGIINKMINNELSKRSLPLPVVVNKAKYNQSTSLTSRKVSTGQKSTTKKRSSKSQMITKQKGPHNDKQYSDPIIQQSYRKPQKSHNETINKSYLLQKLGNLKSIQNSLLILQAEKIQQKQEQMVYSQSKLIQNLRNKIIIKTDQSIQCIDEIHNFERNKFKNEFFDRQNSEQSVQQQKNSQTKQLIQAYINLLEHHRSLVHQELQQSIIQKRYLDLDVQNRESNDNSLDRNRILNRKQFINQNEQDDQEQEQNYLNNSDIMKVNDLLMSPITKKHKNQLIKQKLQSIKVHQISNSQIQNSSHLSEESNQPQLIKQQVKYNNFVSKEQIISKRAQSNGIKKQQSINEQQILIKQQIKPNRSNKVLKQQDGFKPFMSSQMGRQSINNSSGSLQQRIRIGQLKKQQIQKWSYLLQYIKSNMSKQVSTQQVLQHVYDYLSNAKTQLIKQGKSNQSNQFNNNINKQPNNRNKLDEQFTNHLSSQFQKSKDLISQQNIPNYKHQLKQYTISKQLLRKSQNKNQRLKSQQQQILDQEVRSFKDQYESQDQDMKFMNLQTIQSALKNRLKILNQKKTKQLSKLQTLLEQNKLTKQQFQQQKQSIQKWFKTQTNQIQSVKKNIWKGYNQAKGILDKSYIGVKFEQQFKNNKLNKSNQLIKRNNGDRNIYDQKSLQKKNKRMMKCLSETYLKKKINYKQFIQQQQKQLQQKQQHKLLKRQKYQSNEQSSQQNQQQNQQFQQNEQDCNLYDEYNQNQEQIEGWELKNNINKYQHVEYEEPINYDNDDKIDQQQEILEINKQVNQLRQKNIQNLNSNIKEQPISQINKSIQKSIQKSNNINQNSNSFSSHQQKTNQNFAYTNQFSPAIIQYQQISKQLGSQSYSDQNSQHSFTYYPSSQSSQNHPYQYEQQKSVEDHQYNHQLQSTPQPNKNQKQQLITPKPPKLQKQKQQPQHKSSPPASSPSKNKYQLKLLQKLKYLTQDDRQDIFQFLFLDLCIQLYQQPCQDNKIMGAINKFVTKQYQLSKRKKGIKTNLTVVKDYLKRFCGYILRTNKKILTNVNVPMGPTAIQMLRYMHQNDCDDDDPIDDGQGTVTLIIPIQIFDTFQRSLLPTLQFQKYYDNQEKQHQRVNFLKNILHVHNKALFDALNQFLDQQRPFGIWGKPFPWKKAASFPHNFTQIEHEQKLKKSAQKVVQACSYVCGLLIDKEQSLIGNAKVSQAYIEQIRQDRISRMLANDMIQNEERWVFYDDEETQVLVEASNYIYNKLIAEIVGEISLLKENRIDLE